MACPSSRLTIGMSANLEETGTNARAQGFPGNCAVFGPINLLVFDPWSAFLARFTPASQGISPVTMVVLSASCTIFLISTAVQSSSASAFVNGLALVHRATERRRRSGGCPGFRRWV